MAPAEGDDEEWKSSATREMLHDLVSNGTTPPASEIKPREVCATHIKDHPEFAHFRKDLFASRLLSARKRIETKQSQAAIDSEAFAHDRAMFPAPLVDIHGEKKWQGSKAQELLRVDIHNNKHIAMKPKVLYETQEECYENYSLDTFRDRMYQEVKALKRNAYVKKKSEQAALKQQQATEKQKQKRDDDARKKQEAKQQEAAKANNQSTNRRATHSNK